jgi:hypothetical protein
MTGTKQQAVSSKMCGEELAIPHTPEPLGRVIGLGIGVIEFEMLVEMAGWHDSASWSVVVVVVVMRVRVRVLSGANCKSQIVDDLVQCNACRRSSPPSEQSSGISQGLTAENSIVFFFSVLFCSCRSIFWSPRAQTNEAVSLNDPGAACPGAAWRCPLVVWYPPASPVAPWCPLCPHGACSSSCSSRIANCRPVGLPFLVTFRVCQDTKHLFTVAAAHVLAASPLTCAKSAVCSSRECFPMLRWRGGSEGGQGGGRGARRGSQRLSLCVTLGQQQQQQQQQRDWSRCSCCNWYSAPYVQTEVQ